MNEIFMLGGLLALVAALLSLWLVRERDIERAEPIEDIELPQLEPRLEPARDPVAA